MGYVIAGILVLLLVAGFVTFVVLNSMRKRSAKSDHAGPPGIGPDPTPLGDTAEHADENDATRGYDPERAEGRQNGNAGAQTDRQPESERLADRPR